MTDHKLATSPATNGDTAQFVVRELEIDAADDHKLAVAAATVWMNESVQRGGKLGEIIGGAFKLIFKGKWPKSGSPCTRAATVVGQLNGAPAVGVRVHASK